MVHLSYIGYYNKVSVIIIWSLFDHYLGEIPLVLVFILIQENILFREWKDHEQTITKYFIYKVYERRSWLWHYYRKRYFNKKLKT